MEEKGEAYSLPTSGISRRGVRKTLGGGDRIETPRVALSVQMKGGEGRTTHKGGEGERKRDKTLVIFRDRVGRGKKKKEKRRIEGPFI